MEVINSRAALLSNYEVLTLLRELESDHLARTKTAIRIKKEEEASGNTSGATAAQLPFGEASENLRTVEVEAIQYLSADYLPTLHQSSEGITQLVQALSLYDLTKAEKLQVVNLAPTLPVELYVIVEELEDRLGQRMDEILAHVQSAFPLATSAVETTTGNDHLAEPLDVVYEEGEDWASSAYPETDDDVHHGLVFDDTGEGAGVEGDLDMEDD